MAMQILDVGQCGFDGPRMMDLFQHRLGAKVANAADADEAMSLIQQEQFDVILVNRVFAADGGSGVEFIRELREAGVDVPVMLVSDLEDAQKQAVEAGALPGFGKSKLSDPETLEMIKSAAGA